MRTGLSTIQQTLTPEAATVLNLSISEAGRRNHGQTTPLHVASTLLASPTGFLRQACIRSHPNSSHPLQCRALELCFSVALERLPAATSSPAITDPPISNALMAALKRAQAHQRRGCPEQQQQPLLAVKVELEQLIISILDDPSVSRVMREASFSSPAVKATIEQTLNNSGSSGFRPAAVTPVSVQIPNRNLYLNPRLQQINLSQEKTESVISVISNTRNLNTGSSRENGIRYLTEVNKFVEIMTKPNKKNPILVGESEPEAIRTEILKRIENGALKNVEIVSIENDLVSIIDKSMIPVKIKELGDLVEKKVGGVVIDLGDLKWLVEQAPAAVGAAVGRESVAEMAKIVAKFAGKVWLIGTATCETYLRCQVYHPSMETDWDLQAVPITSRSPIPAMFPRMGTTGILGNSGESLNPLKSFLPTTNLDLTRKARCCPTCSNGFEQEVERLKEFEKPPDEVKSNLPQWLQNAKLKDQSQIKDQEMVLKQKIQELQKKWSDECLRNHPNYNQNPRLDRIVPMVVPLTVAYKPNMLLRQSQPGQLSQQPRLHPPRLEPVRLEPPRSPVGTDLVLGPKKTLEADDLAVKDLLGCISSEPQKGKFANSADTDSFKKLLKGLMKKAWWQPEAASTIATTVTQCKVDSGSRGSVWLLFTGPDRVGKKKMASVLAEHVSGTHPITICLGSNRDGEETDMGFRGKTVLDRIVEAVRRNPSSVIVLLDIDEANSLIRASVKRAMESGRITDSHGREISLGNVVFVLTGNWSTANLTDHQVDEQRLHALATRDWQLRLTVIQKRLKRRSHWLSGQDRSRKPRKESGLDLDLSLDLNLAIDHEDDQDQDQDQDRTNGSINSSILEQEDENQHFAVASVPHDLVGPSDGAVVFKPVQFGNIRREIEKTIKNAFSNIIDENMNITIEVEECAIENILGGLWFGQTSLEEWAERVLVPSFDQVKNRLAARGEDMVVRLESDRDSGQVGGAGDWLPNRIPLLVEGL